MKMTKSDLKKSQKCPPGMKIMALTAVKEGYIKDNGCEVIPVEFETEDGYIVPFWFNSTVMDMNFQFLAAADNVTFDVDNYSDIEFDEELLKKYVGKKVAGEIKHVEDKNGKPQANIMAFYTADKVPF